MDNIMEIYIFIITNSERIGCWDAKGTEMQKVGFGNFQFIWNLLSQQV